MIIGTLYCQSHFYNNVYNLQLLTCYANRATHPTLIGPMYLMVGSDHDLLCCLINKCELIFSRFMAKSIAAWL